MGPTQIDATLILLRSNHEPLRTPTVEGYYYLPPTIGERFEFYGPPLDPREYLRWIITTPVVLIERMGEETRFGTQNSLYRLLGRPA